VRRPPGGGGVDGLHVGVGGTLGIDGDEPAVRELHDHVGSLELAVAIAQRVLLGEIAVAGHACEFGDAPELDLAVAAADIGAAEGADELAGLLAQRLAGLAGGGGLLLEACEAVAGFAEGLADGADEFLDCAAALVEFGLALGLLARESLASELEESLLRAVEGLAGDLLEQTPGLLVDFGEVSFEGLALADKGGLAFGGELLLRRESLAEAGGLGLVIMGLTGGLLDAGCEAAPVRYEPGDHGCRADQ
jgi:hypothetical protein